MGFKISGIDHIVLRTANLESMLGFYRDVLGCQVERETDPETGLVQLRAGHALIDLVTVDGKLGQMGGGPPGATGNNLDHFCLQVDTLFEDDILTHLDDHGIEHGGFEERYGAQGFGNSVYLKDPDGNTVELRERI
jgi:catechol 2,3-dioxygenase-like lactoylglutathione lyase family enzyme